MKTLIETIKEADPVELDASFCVLRDRGLGVMRKLKCWSLILDIEEETVLKEAPKDSNGRIIDYETRHQTSDALVARSKELKEQNK